MKQLPSGEWVGVPVREGPSGVTGRLPTGGTGAGAANRYRRATALAQELDQIERTAPPQGMFEGMPPSAEALAAHNAEQQRRREAAIGRWGFQGEDDFEAALREEEFVPGARTPPPPDVKPGLPGLSFDDYLGTRGVGVAPARQVEPGSVTESGPDLSSTPSIPGVGGGGMVTTAPPELLGDVAQDYQFSDDPAQAMRDDGWGEGDIAHMMDLLGF